MSSFYFSDFPKLTNKVDVAKIKDIDFRILECSTESLVEWLM
jgi:hypothetical protein